MVTKEIAGGARLAEAAHSVKREVPQGDAETAAKFVAVLEQILSGTGGMMIQQGMAALAPPPIVAAAKPPEREPEAVHEEPVQREEGQDSARLSLQDEEEESGSESGTRETDSTPVPVQMVNARECSHEVSDGEVQGELAGETLTGDVLKDRQPDDMTEEQVKSEVPTGVGDGAQEKLATASQTQAPVAGERGLTPETATEVPADSEGEVAPSGSGAAAKGGAKGDDGRIREKSRDEQYAEIESVMNVSNESSAAAETPLGESAPSERSHRTTVAGVASGAFGDGIAAQNRANGVSESAPSTTGAAGAVKPASITDSGEAGAFGQSGLADKLGALRAKGTTGTPGSGVKNQEKLLLQIQDLLKRAAQSRDGNTVSVRVDPPELGMVTVKVTQRDSQLYARIIPDSPDVENVLRTRVEEVTQVLIAAGLRADQVHISIGRERTDAELFSFRQSADRWAANDSSNGADRNSNGGSQGRGERDGLRDELDRETFTTGGFSQRGAAGNGSADLGAGWVA